MRRFSVTGMHCAGCAARVEKAVRAVPGVEECAVNLLLNSMGVEGTAADGAIVAAVEAAGFGAKAEAEAEAEERQEVQAERDAEAGLKGRLAWSAGLLAALLYVTMGHGMLGWPLPGRLAEPLAEGVLQLVLSGAVLALNGRFFSNGFKGLARGGPNMDTLVALGAGTAWVWSAAVLVAGRGGHFFFESAAMIVTLVSVGKLLEARAKGKTTSALAALAKLAPKTATVVRDGKETVVAASDVRAGDEFVVRPGEHIPADGVVVEGGGAVDESALTGESVPVDKAAGGEVSAATTNVSGFLRCRATRVGRDTALAQIVRLMQDAAATKAPIAKTADRVSAVFVPAVLAVAAASFGAWLWAGAAPETALARAIAVLVTSCPCALGLATPVAIVVGCGVGARRGILFKTAAALEAAGRARTVVLDKTGTLTEGEPRVAGVRAAEGTGGNGLLAFAAALERGSEHPLARAVVREAERRGVASGRAEGFRALPGCGVEGRIDGEPALGGSAEFVKTRLDVPVELQEEAWKQADAGRTPLLFAKGGRALGVVAVADSLKEGAAEAVSALKGMGIRVVMLTGDNERTARAVAAEAGVDEVVAGVMPDGKHRAVGELKRGGGGVAMVGDGVNDAPALAAADVGMAVAAGTDVAVDAADVVLMKSRPGDIPAALRLGRATLRNIRQNLFWAFAYNVMLIPLAAGAWEPLTGWKMHPALGALAMGLSSFCVVTNALRLNFARIENQPERSTGK